MRKYYIILCFWIIVSCKVDEKQLPYYDTPDFTPKWEMTNESIFHKIRPFELINQENESFTEYIISSFPVSVNG